MHSESKKESKTLVSVVQNAASKALPSGAAGGLAMGLNIITLMWLRTTVNYQYKYGTGSFTAIGSLYAEGGVLRFYRGLLPALFQGPLSRFGDTAANTGIMVVLDSYDETAHLNTMVKTGFCSLGAASWRLFLMPIDTLKTTMQTDGSRGMSILWEKFRNRGPSVFYYGGFGAVVANIVGYYPWFATYNQMDSILPKVDSEGNELTGLNKLGRRAVQGFCASGVSDICSNSIRVVKVYKQTNTNANISYMECAKEIIEVDGISGLLGRGLRTKLVANGIQGAMFSILWKTLEPMFFTK